MLARQRREKILEMIVEDGAARVSGLRDIFGVSEVTIRKDLEKLAVDGHIVRDHGGAYLKSLPEQVQSLALQHREHMDKKARIGESAAALVENGDSLILDAGSTTTEVARHLWGRESLTVVTNALNIALTLGAGFGHDIVVTGGEFKAPTLSLTADRAAEGLRDIRVDKVFLATAGFSVDTGLTYPGFSDLPVKRAMIEAGRLVYLVADSSKYGKQALARLGALNLVDVVITDRDIDARHRQEMEQAGLEVIVS